MKINIQKIMKQELPKNEVNLKLEVAENNAQIEKLMEYLQNYESQKIVVNKDNKLLLIEEKEIICFYSDKKYNYCRTTKEEFRIKSKLYELEKRSNEFLRISKSCVVNIAQVRCFDIGQTGRIIVKFYDNTEETVSRRKIKDVMNYLEERGI